MKKLMILAISIALFRFSAYAADTYIPVTPDDTVETLEEVVVKKSTPVTKEQNWSLNTIDRQIADIEANKLDCQERIADWDTRITELQAMKPLVEKEAKKVKLKEKEEKDK